MKRCPRCEGEFPVEDFGSSDYCRPCNRARVREWQAANPEKHKANQARTRNKNRVKRREAALARYYRLMDEDPERVRSQRRAWVKTEKGVIQNRLARHKRRGAALDDLSAEWASIILRDPCSYCGEPAVELDHILPLNADGEGGWENLAPACRRCNAQKNDRSLLTFVSASSEGVGANLTGALTLSTL